MAMFRVILTALALILGANIFGHICGMKRLIKNKGLRAAVGAVLAVLALLSAKDGFSTDFMIYAVISAGLWGFDLLCLLSRAFGRDNRVRRALTLLRACGLALALSIAVAVYGYVNMALVKETRYSVASRKLENGVVIGLISDAHLGGAIHPDGVADAMRRALDAGADALILAGDIADESTDRGEFYLFVDKLRDIRARLGVYFVFGNHDGEHYGGKITCAEMEEALADAGVTVLTDESVLLEGNIRIIGRNNVSPARASLETLMDGVDAEKEFVIVVDHQPVETKACAEAGADLLLSGHTHNGQLFTVGVISRAFHINEVEYGLEKIGDMYACVSSGISGWGGQMRTAGHSEYVILQISGAQNE